MKKLLLSLVLVLGAGISANAQCTPDPQFTDPGVYPDSATGLAAACADQPYNETITIIVPVDTTVVIVFPFTMVFDTVNIVSWTGLPPGFTYACYDAQNTISPPDGCAFEGGTTGCVSINGNPTQADIGSYQQIITTEAWMTPDNPAGEPTQTVVDYYYIQITSCTTNVSSITNSKFMAYPNPAKDVVTLNGLNGIDVNSVSVYSSTGTLVTRYDEVTGPELHMDINDVDKGLYFINISYDGKTEVLKFVKE